MGHEIDLQSTDESAEQASAATLDTAPAASSPAASAEAAPATSVDSETSATDTPLAGDTEQDSTGNNGKKEKKEEKFFGINIKVLVGVLVGVGFVVTVSAFIFGTIYNTRHRKTLRPPPTG